jgi:hypothetical protein
VRSKKDELRTRHEKEKSEPGTQERDTAISISPLLYCGIAKLRRIQ